MASRFFERKNTVDFVWIGILIVSFAVSAGVLIVIRRVKAGRLFYTGIAAFAALILVAFTVKNILNVPIVLLHNGVFLIVTMCVDGICSAYEKRHKKQESEEKKHKRAPVFVAAAAGCMVYLLIGLFCANRIKRTEYMLTTAKELPNGQLCIVQLSDVHLGTTIDEKDFRKLLKRVSDEKPDVVVITGDYTDVNTKRDLMVRCCEALGELKPTYGVFYIGGNHDSEDMKFTPEELRKELQKNGVTVLSDEVFLTNSGVSIIGRKDHSVSRDNMRALQKRCEEIREEQAWAVSEENSAIGRYTIVLDHQPDDFSAEAEAGVDLVLCGHAHGGFLLPLRWVWKVFPDVVFRVDLCDGTKRIADTDFIVSTGAGTCLTDFKTGTVSEYVVIYVKQEK